MRVINKIILKLGIIVCLGVIIFAGSNLSLSKNSKTQLPVTYASNLGNEGQPTEPFMAANNLQMETEEATELEVNLVQIRQGFHETNTNEVHGEPALESENTTVFEMNSFIQSNGETEGYILLVPEDDEDKLQSAINWVIENDAQVLQLNLENNEEISIEAQNLVKKAIESGTLLIIDDSYEFLNGESDQVLRVLTDTDYQRLGSYDSYSVDQNYDIRDSVVIIPEHYNILEALSILLKTKPSLTNEQLLNVIQASTDPIFPSNSHYGYFNLNRAIELINEMSMIEKVKTMNDNPIISSIEATRNNSLSLSNVLSSTTPGITAANITSNSITWNVKYITSGIWGNRLEYHDFTSGSWSDLSQSYYTQNGSYTSTNLIPGNLYLGRLTYYVDKWYTVDINVSTEALYSPSFLIEDITSNTFTINVKFPANSVYGNELFVHDLVTNEKKNVTNSNKTANGKYTVSGLVTNRQYKVQMGWYKDGWQALYQTVTVKPQVNQLSYSYDIAGQLIQIQDQAGKILAKYTYDLHGNLLRVQKF